MAPLKALNKQPTSFGASSLISMKTRSQAVTMKKESKRKAEGSPLKRAPVKRSAFGDLTNAHSKENDENKLKTTLKKCVLGMKIKPLAQNNAIKPPVSIHIEKEIKKLAVTGTTKPAATVTVKPLGMVTTKQGIATATTLRKKTLPTFGGAPRTLATLPKPKPVVKEPEPVRTTGPVTRRSSGRKSSDLEKTSDTSLYVSALEALELDDPQKKSSSLKITKQERRPPLGIEDFDKENMEDLPSVAVYAMDIFEYLKSREKSFVIGDYLEKQTNLNKTMRALLVDWMVEVQENFELNHETLYLAVKIVDLYLSRVIVTKENLQLVGCASMFVACKYDERSPPLIEDFLYVCDDLYTANELTAMEVKVLKTLEFNLGVPLSYRFLRRYARCMKAKMPLLTLARYILESSLMDYSLIRYSDSKLAAASLLLAIIMKEKGKWTPILEYYTGYKVSDLKEIVCGLNTMLHKKTSEKLRTIKAKYSHELFFQVAQTPLVDDVSL